MLMSGILIIIQLEMFISYCNILFRLPSSCPRIKRTTKNWRNESFMIRIQKFYNDKPKSRIFKSKNPKS